MSVRTSTAGDEAEFSVVIGYKYRAENPTTLWVATVDYMIEHVMVRKTSSGRHLLTRLSQCRWTQAWRV